MNFVLNWLNWKSFLILCGLWNRFSEDILNGYLTLLWLCYKKYIINVIIQFASIHDNLIFKTEMSCSILLFIIKNIESNGLKEILLHFFNNAS